MRIVFVGGRTGGHFYPLIAIAEAVRVRFAELSRPIELFYMGPHPYDHEALRANSITFVRCPSGKLRRYRSILNIFSPLLVMWGTAVALFKLFTIYPDAVMSKGGDTSVPVVVAAWLLRIPIVVHESDASAGRANRLAARFARHVGIAYQETAEQFPREKTALVGIPIRHELQTQALQNGREVLGIETPLPLILVLGGSSGAERLNTLILESLDELLPSYGIIHQTGKDHAVSVQKTAETLIRDPELQNRYHPVGFLSALMLHTAYGVASIVISRAGSTTIFENAIHKKPAILIPIPEEISHDQRKNAYAYARGGGAIVMEEGNLRDGLLAAEIARIMGDSDTYQSMSEAAGRFAPNDAAERLADLLLRIGDEHNS